MNGGRKSCVIKGRVCWGTAMGRAAFAAAGFLALWTAPARAIEDPFSHAVPAQTLPQGRLEFDRNTAGRFDNGFSRYDAVDFSNALTYGLTGDFQIGLSVDSGYLHAVSDADGLGGSANFPRNIWYFQGVGASFTYRPLDPNKGGWGLAFSIAPGWKRADPFNGRNYGGGYGVEYRTLVQRNFLQNRLILLYNLVLDAASVRYSESTPAKKYEGTFDLENDLGMTYRFARLWAAGVELRNENAEPGKDGQSFIWAGPALHFGNERFWSTLGFMEQVWRSSPSARSVSTVTGDNIYLRALERHEIVLRGGIRF